MNQGRIYHRMLQAHCKRIMERGFIPTEARPHERVFQAIRGDEKIFVLSDRDYIKKNIRNYGVYQTCTYVRVS